MIARWQIDQSSLVTTEIRIWEFLNYYEFTYDAAAANHLNVVPDLRLSDEDEGGSYSMQIGVRSEDITNEERRPLNLTLSLDTSGSMGGSPIQRLKAVCNAIAHNLEDGDVVSIVKWSNSSAILLDTHAVSGPDDPTLTSVIDGITAGGSTNLYAGLQVAYQQAQENVAPGRMNRVVLISDGQANAGVQATELISEMAGDSENEGIYLAGIGTGNGYDDTLMDDVTDAGKGAYLFIDSAEEAELQFGDPTRFVANLEIAAADVRVELTLPVGWYIEEFHGEQSSTNPGEVDPQHLAPNDSMIFHQIVSTCGDIPVSGDEQIECIAHHRDPETWEPRSNSSLSTVSSLLGGTSIEMYKGDAIVAYALALEEIQTLMYSPSDYSEILDIIDSTRDQVQTASTALGGDPELDEVDALLEQYRTKFD